jgi:hypothetical protein
MPGYILASVICLFRKWNVKFRSESLLDFAHSRVSFLRTRGAFFIKGEKNIGVAESWQSKKQALAKSTSGTRNMALRPMPAPPFVSPPPDRDGRAPSRGAMPSSSRCTSCLRLGIHRSAIEALLLTLPRAKLLEEFTARWGLGLA